MSTGAFWPELAKLTRPLKIAGLPSNQHLNDYAGIADPKVTEELWAVGATQAGFGPEIERQGHTFRMFWTPGTGSKSTDELDDMLRACVSWGPDLVFSIHSDVDGHNHRDIFNQIRSEAQRPWGDGVGRMLAGRLGFSFQASAVRGHNLMFYYYGGMPSQRALLLEIGSHDSKEDSEFNMRYQTYEGIMAARCALAVSLGKLAHDGPVPHGVAVPPGFERFLPCEATPEQMPRLEINWRQRHRLLPFTKDPAYSTSKLHAPVWYLQWKLNVFYDAREALPINGIYDPNTEQAVRVFQQERGLPVTGITDAGFWRALMA